MTLTAVQTTYGGAPAARLNGKPTIEPEGEKSVRALEPIYFGGQLVYGYDGGASPDKNTVRHPQQNKSTLTQSIDYEASNSTVGDVTVTDLAGVAVTTSLTATVYASSHTATQAAIATKIAAISGILSATPDPTAKTITVIASGDNKVVLSGFVTTLGTNQATYTYTAGSVDTIAGVAERMDLDTGNPYFATGDNLKMLTNGRVGCVTDETITSGDAPYVRFAAGSGTNEWRGILRKTAGTSPVVAIASTGKGFLAVHTGAAADAVTDFAVNLLGA